MSAGSNGRVLVTTYTNPDLDGFGCCLAYAELLHRQGRDAWAGIFGTPIVEVQFMLREFDIATPPPIPDDAPYEHVILVDASDSTRLAPELDPPRVVEVIDHHQVHNAAAFVNAAIQIELVGAAATLIAERYETAGMLPSRDHARLLVGGIISNTFNFKAPLTTGRDHHAFDWLEPIAQLPHDFVQQLYRAKSDLPGDLLKTALVSDVKEFSIRGHRIIFPQLEVAHSEVILQRKDELLVALQELQTKHPDGFTFLSIIDVESEMNTFITAHLPSQQLLHDVLHLDFVQDTAVRPGILMRKQIIPLIKQHLES